MDNQIKEEYEDLKNLEEKNYKKGLIAGFLIATAVFLILVLAFNYNMRKNGRKLIVANNVENMDDISYKIGLIEAYLDEYYMEEVDYDVLEQGIYHGLVDSLGDIYTTYYTPEQYEKVKESSSGEYCGIGVVIRKQKNDSDIVVQQVYRNSPANEAGIKEGDIIYSINGEIIGDITTDELVSLIVGEEDSKFKMGVKRDGEILEFELVRKQIEKDIVTYEMKDNNIGYIKIDEFDEVTASQVKEGIKELQSKGMQKLVIDLRNNPGGMLTSVQEVASMFLPDDKLFLYSETKDGDRTDYYTEGEPLLPDMPVSVLINEESASASEAFSGAMKAYDRAKLVGTTSFGKGIMQSIFAFNDGSALKITVGKYYLPDGSNIHETGITPDVEIEDDISTEADEQLDKAIEILN